MSRPSLEDLIQSCLEAPPSERSRVVERLCATHPDEAASLRRMYAQLCAMGFLDEPGDKAALWRLPERLGNYRLEGPLGTGGMGVVFRARHESLSDRVVAVKLIRPDLVARPQTRARFLREAMLASRLDHPNVCGVLDLGHEHGVAWLAMPFVDGESLADRIARARQRRSVDPRALPEVRAGEDASLDDVLAAFIALANGVAHAHACGLLHRDVKPGNVVLRRDGTPVLLDFGLAREVDPHTVLTLSHDVVGTPAYMSPEQTEGRADVDGRADVYGLGATLFECLTLELPHTGRTRDELLARIRNEPAPDPRRLAPWLPRSVADVVRGALAPDRGNRYPSAAALADDLDRARRGGPVSIRAPAPWRRAAAWVRRNPWPTVAGAVLTLALVAAALLLDRTRSAERSARADAWVGAALAAERFDEIEALDAALLAFDTENTQRTREQLHRSLRRQRFVSRLAVGEGDGLALLFSDDGARLAVAFERWLAVLERDGDVIEHVDTGIEPADRCEFAEVDGTITAAMGRRDGTLAWWRAGRPEAVPVAGFEAAAMPRRRTFRCSAVDGKLGVAVFGTADGVVEVDLRTGRAERWSLDAPDGVHACAVLRDGTVVAAANRPGGASALLAWRARASREVRSVTERAVRHVNAMAPAAHPGWVWLGLGEGVARFCPSSGEVVKLTEQPREGHGRLLVVDDGFVYRAAPDGPVYRWHATGQRPPTNFEWHPSPVETFAVRGPLVATTGIDQWGVQLGHRKGTAIGPPIVGFGQRCTRLAIDPRGEVVAVASADGVVSVCRIGPGQESFWNPEGTPFGQFVVAPDDTVRIGNPRLAWSGAPRDGAVTLLEGLDDAGGRALVALHGPWMARGSTTGWLSLHDARTGAVSVALKLPDSVVGIRFIAPDRLWVAVNGGPGVAPRLCTFGVAADGTALVETSSMAVEVASTVTRGAWRIATASPDGTTCAIACTDGSVLVCEHGRVVGEPLPHCPGEPCWNVALTPDGSHVLSAGNDGRVLLWRRAADGSFGSAEIVTTFVKPATAVAFDDGAGRVACASFGGTVRVLSTAGFAALEEFDTGSATFCCRFARGDRLRATTLDGQFLTWFLDHDELRRRAAQALRVSDGGPRRRGRTGSREK